MAPDRGTPDEFEEIAIVGAGRMGHGIALAYARQGHPVRVYDVDEGVLDACEGRIRSALETLAANDRIDEAAIELTLDRLSYHGALSDAVGGVDLVTEAVAEDPDVKREVFAELADLSPPDAVLATNTSGLPIDRIAEPIEDAGRFLATHWFNPPYLVPLVEIVRGEQTDQAVVDRVRALIDSIGQVPVVLEKDVPGFLGNRIQMAMAYEALSLLDRGVASAADIDRAVKAGFGFRLPIMGIFEKIDQSGVGIHHRVEESLLPELDRGTTPSDVLTRLVEADHQGLQSGKGIYDWTATSPADVEARRDRALLRMRELFDATVADPPPQHTGGPEGSGHD